MNYGHHWAIFTHCFLAFVIDFFDLLFQQLLLFEKMQLLHFYYFLWECCFPGELISLVFNGFGYCVKTFLSYEYVNHTHWSEILFTLNLFSETHVLKFKGNNNINVVLWPKIIWISYILEVHRSINREELYRTCEKFTRWIQLRCVRGYQGWLLWEIIKDGCFVEGVGADNLSIPYPFYNCSFTAEVLDERTPQYIVMDIIMEMNFFTCVIHTQKKLWWQWISSVLFLLWSSKMCVL